MHAHTCKVTQLRVMLNLGQSARALVSRRATRYTLPMRRIEAKAADMIGPYIKKRVIPAGMTVTEAARRLGVGRPALSNLLNGKASLSHEMALRLEKTFGADRDELLDRQSGLERQRRRDGDGAVAAGRFVPPFLVIKARDIEAWADRTDARQLLAVLLRTLVHSTGDGLRRVDFPGGDNAQRRGWDGWLEADSATPWIPSGESCWEFGVSGDPRRKAEQDYNQRLSAADRARLTFVFVTPRNWPQKKTWAIKKSTVGDWKAVQALDADDLEQWLEQSIAGQVWFADQLGRPTQGCTPLDRFWEKWRSDCEPAITEMMFTPAVDMHLADFKRWLDMPGDRPLTIAADSAEEAVAFVACLFRHSDIPPETRDRAVVIDRADTMRTLALSTSPFIPIVRRDDVERELGPVCRRFPCIAVRPRNAIAVRPRNAVESLTIEIPLLGYEGFRAALSDMSIHDYDEVARLARESGRSPTILRRRLSPISAINTPQWAQDHEVAQRLIPMILIGAWDKKSEADRHVLSEISGCAYDEVEQRVAELWALDDPPVWCVGQYRGVASKIDALFAVSGSITDSAVDGFLEIARHVLPEADPALTLPEDQRWAASMFDKVRKHSSAVLRSNVGETLVLLAVHGNHLLQSRLGVDVKARVAQLIGRLLSPMRADTLRSHERELPLYAEAAPEMFLDLLEADLKKPNPAVFDLLQPVGPGWLVQPYRIGLLRALDLLAWSPHFLPRVANILARLSEVDIEDNWTPKPLTSLASILHSRLPQTAASLDERIRCMKKMIIRQWPDVGWRLCVMQLRGSMGESNYRPRWRTDAVGFGTGVSNDETREFINTTLEIMMNWCSHNQNTLGDLIDLLNVVPEGDRTRVWELVDQFAGTATDPAKAALYERINRYAFSERGIVSRNVTDAVRSDARAALGKLVARDPVVRHGWKFAKQWVAGVDNYTDGSDDQRYAQTQQERAHRIREDAMAEIWKAQGWKGVTELLANSEAPETIGMYVAVCVDRGHAAADLVSTARSSDAVVPSTLDRFMRGFFGALDESERDAVLLAAANAPGHDDAACARLFTWAPLGERTWCVLDRQPRQVLECYWRDVSVSQRPVTKAELGHLLARLLDAKRPRAAFRASYGSWKDIETALLKRLLNGLARAEDRDPIDYAELSFALDELDKRVDIIRDEMARLEWVFLPALDHSDDNLHGIPNLERIVSEAPRLFAQAVALCSMRNDGGEDPPNWRVNDHDMEISASHAWLSLLRPLHWRPVLDRLPAGVVVCEAAYALLRRLRRIPGTDDDGVVHWEILSAWCAEVRRLCAEHDRIEVGDEHLGQLLSNAPTDRDGTWPCRPVCEVMEGIGSLRLRDGFQNGVYDARGVHVRGMEDGGDQERRLAEKWRSRAERLTFDYPFVSTVLDGIARTYEGEATQKDTQAQARMRMGR